MRSNAVSRRLRVKSIDPSTAAAARGPDAPAAARRGLRSGLRRAFSLIELIAAVTIISILSGMAIPPIGGSIDKARVARAIGDLRTVAQQLSALDSLPASLTDIGRGDLRDPWGQPYTYVVLLGGSGPPGDPRRDRFMVAINSRFDLYSRGPDGLTDLSLTAATGRDDVVVGNDGGYIGSAAKY